MTNQTIDGVSRALLESFAAYVADSPNAVMRSRAAQLRALLDAPAVSPPLSIPDECPHMIVFDDTDREQMVFAGAGARDAALKTWDKISGSWNAHLFVRIERNSRDDRYPSATFVPAAQPQGEPVVWLDPESGLKANTISAELKKYNEGKGGAPASVAARYTVPLYRGRPPAPTVCGWKLVPIKPTLEMLRAVDDEAGDKHLARGRAASAWGLMLDTAPLPSILDLPYDLAHAVECELPERDLVGGHKLGGVYFPTPSHLASAVAGAGDGVALEPAAPILVEAVAVTRESAEDGLCLEWLVEGGIAALEFPGTYLLVAQGELTNDSGNGYVYRARNPEDDA